MKKIALLLFCQLVFAVGLFAQSKDTSISAKRQARIDRRAERLANTHVFNAKSFGFVYQNEQHTVVSPLVYSGVGLALSNERQRFLYSTMTRNYGSASYNLLKAAESTSLGHSVTAQFGYDYLKKAFFENFHIGGMVQMNANVTIKPELSNNILTSEVFANLGVSSHYKRDFKLFNRPLQLEVSARLPLLGVVNLLPDYSYSFDKVPNFSFFSLHNSFLPQTQVWLNLPTSKRYPMRQYRVGYEWRLNRFASGNDHHVTTGTHTLHVLATLDKWR
ncbi:MAG: hypothetical protein U5L45_14215 [Saprospiraceae bacterium]|nr:hypothetical protein [Saprospiraceae bacterium]